MTRSLTKRDKLLLHGFITVFGYVDDWSINEIELAESVLFYKRQIHFIGGLVFLCTECLKERNLYRVYVMLMFANYVILVLTFIQGYSRYSTWKIVTQDIQF